MLVKWPSAQIFPRLVHTWNSCFFRPRWPEIGLHRVSLFPMRQSVLKRQGYFLLFTSVFLVPTIVLGIWCAQLLFPLPGGISVKKIIFGFELPSITITTSKLHKAPLNSGRVNMTGIICLALKQQSWDFSGSACGKEPTCQCSRH